MVKACVKGNEYMSFSSYSSKAFKRKKKQSDSLIADDLSRDKTPMHQPSGVYAVYKKATEAVRDGLAKLLPRNFRLVSLDDYKRGANMVVRQSIEISDGKRSDVHLITVEQTVFHHLNTAIRLREEQAQKHGDFCEGHQYIIQVLKYCREVLQFNNEVVESVRKTPVEDTSPRKTVKPSRKKKKKASCRSPLKAIHSKTSNCHEVNKTHREDSPEKHVTVVEVQDLNDDDSTMMKGGQNADGSNTRTTPHETVGENNKATRSTAEPIVQHLRQLNEKVKHLQAPKQPDYSSAIPQCPESMLLAADADLVMADDRFQCIAFLETMDQFMGKIQSQFDEVKRTCLEDFDGHEPIYRLMEASVATNIYVETVKSVWAELTLEHPHIRHFYDLFAIVFVMPSLPATKYQDVFATKTKEQPNIVTCLVGDIVEACFMSEGMNIDEALVNFQNSVNIPDGNWEKDALMEEAQLMLFDVYDLITEHGSHKIRMSFLSNYKYIGGKRCILNSALVTQQVFEYIANTKDVIDACPEVAKAGQKTFTHTFHEDKNPARGIRCDLDQSLASEILPQIIAGSYDDEFQGAKNSGSLKMVSTLLVDMDEYERDSMGDAVPPHLIFALHAILTSILSLQGNGTVERLATKAKSFACDYIDGLEQSKILFNPNLKEYKSFKASSEAFCPKLTNLPNSHLLYGYWNPVVAGALCTFMVYNGIHLSMRFLSIGLYQGVHIYNALRGSGVLEGELPSFEIISNIFTRYICSVSSGKKPQRGDYCKSYLHGQGYNIRDVSYILDCVKRRYGIQTNSHRFLNDRRKNIRRDLKHAKGLRASECSFGFASILTGGSSTNGDMSSKIPMECDMRIENACKAIRADLVQFGGVFPDFINMGIEIRDWARDIVQKLDFDTENDFALSILAQLDFQSSSLHESTMAFQAARMMEQRFDCSPLKKYNHNWSHHVVKP